MKLPKPGALRRELTIVIIVKLIFLGLLWYCFFSTPPALDQNIMSRAPEQLVR